jgi:hypothetical protein
MNEVATDSVSDHAKEKDCVDHISISLFVAFNVQRIIPRVGLTW